MPYNQLFQPDKERRNLRVQAVARDSLGYIWIATTEGLYRFNGFDFTQVPASGPGESAPVTALSVAGDGKVWCGYRNGTAGFVRGDSILRVRGLAPSVSRINVIFADSHRRTWFGTNGNGLYILDGDSLFHVGRKDGLNDDVVYALAEDGKGNVYAGTDEGIFCCSFVEGRIIATAFRGNSKLPDSIVRSLLLLGDSLYIGTQDRGMFVYDLSRNTYREGFGKTTGYGGWNTMMTNDDMLYAGTDKGLVRLALAGGDSVAGNATGLENRIFSFVNDLENNLWIACSDGLYRSSGEKIRFLPGTGKDAYSFVHSILADSRGRIWFSPDQGLRCLDPAGKEPVKSYVVTPPKALVDIVTLCEDSFGNIWIGTVGAGLFRLDPRSGAVEKITDPALTHANILSLACDGHTVWAAGFEGVYCFVREGEKKFRAQRFGENSPLKNSYIYRVFPDSRGRTWFGLDGQGLAMYDGHTFTMYGEKEGLRSNVVYSITEDRQHNIWFCTLDAGIYCFDGKKFTSYSLDQGLSDLTYSSVIADPSGNILAVGNSGIDVIRSGNGDVLNFGPEYGIADIHPDANAVTMDPSGVIWMGTEKGIIRYDSRAFSKKPLRCFLSGTRLFLAPVDTSRHEFRYDEDNVTFDYMALHYSNPGKVSYRYQLDGFTPGWNITRERSVTFPKLPPGTYTFRVQASLSRDFSKVSEAAWSFTIHPPFWQHTGFRLAVLAFLAGLLVLYIRQRERQLRRVERLEQEKIRFQFQVLKNQVNPHFLFNSFNTLISFIEENPRVAVEYVEQLAAFFRHVVTYREKEVITLEEEFLILRNYFFIQKKRYGEPFSMDMNISMTDQQRYFIPPLTLQILVENAIKHNAVSRETPLHISIRCDDGFLVVENNRNPKRMQEPSSGLGLENVRSRYSLLTRLPVDVEAGEEFFRVRLPLLSA